MLLHSKHDISITIVVSAWALIYATITGPVNYSPRLASPAPSDSLCAAATLTPVCAFYFNTYRATISCCKRFKGMSPFTLSPADVLDPWESREANKAVIADTIRPGSFWLKPRSLLRMDLV